MIVKYLKGKIYFTICATISKSTIYIKMHSFFFPCKAYNMGVPHCTLFSFSCDNMLWNLFWWLVVHFLNLPPWRKKGYFKVCLLHRCQKQPRSSARCLWINLNLFSQLFYPLKKILSEIGRWIVYGSKRLSAFLNLTSMCIHEFSPHETEDGVPLLSNCPLACSRKNYCLTGLSESYTSEKK